MRDCAGVNWAALSPRSCRILREIAILVAPPLYIEEVDGSPSGLSYAQAAAYLQERRETILDLRPPNPVTASWVQARLGELRKDADAASTT